MPDPIGQMRPPVSLDLPSYGHAARLRLHKAEGVSSRDGAGAHLTVPSVALVPALATRVAEIGGQMYTSVESVFIACTGFQKQARFLNIHHDGAQNCITMLTNKSWSSENV